jgi:hypothetical protein
MSRIESGGFGEHDLRMLALIVVGAALMVLSGPVAAQTPQEVQALAEQAIRRLNLQTQFEQEPRSVPFALPGELLWIVVIVAIAVLLYAFRDLIPAWRSQRAAEWTADEAGQGDSRAGRPVAALGAADQLAAEGRIAEAMHVLLLQGLAAIRERLDERFADSLTSREILRSTRLSEAGRTSLRDIVNRVELTYFGRHPAALADYVACRASFNALTQVLLKSVPA